MPGTTLTATERPDQSSGGATARDSREADTWRLEDIDFLAIDRSLVAHDEDLFFLLCGASFVEIASETYTRHLAQYCADDAEVTGWLTERWQRDELQHGAVLKAYVTHTWPDFPWQQAYDGFFADYVQACTVEDFAPTRALEMVARCVVEAGTATYYRSLHVLTEEPVLRQITDFIRADEVRHYKHFHRYFKHYNRTETHGRTRILVTIVRRLRELRDGDATCAFWHAFHLRYPDEPRGGKRFNDILARSSLRLKRQFPLMMAIKMLLKPLALPPAFQFLHLPLAKLAQFVILR